MKEGNELIAGGFDCKGAKVLLETDPRGGGVTFHLTPALNALIMPFLP